jgi:hypothetical protein
MYRPYRNAFTIVDGAAAALLLLTVSLYLFVVPRWRKWRTSREHPRARDLQTVSLANAN